MALRISTSGANTIRFSTALSCANISRVAHSACGVAPRLGLAIAPPSPRTIMRLSTYGTHNRPVIITVNVSQNNSGVSSPGVMGNPPRTISVTSPAGRHAYSRALAAALCADPNITAGGVFDRRKRVGADAACRHLLGVDGGKPFAPVRPPGAFVLLRALDPVR